MAICESMSGTGREIAFEFLCLFECFEGDTVLLRIVGTMLCLVVEAYGLVTVRDFLLCHGLLCSGRGF